MFKCKRRETVIKWETNLKPSSSTTSFYVVRHPYLQKEVEIEFVRNLNITPCVKKFKRSFSNDCRSAEE